MPPCRISYLTDVYFDFDAVRFLGELLAGLGITRPLIVTDANLVRVGMIERLGVDNPVVFDHLQTNPTEAAVKEGLDRYRQASCDGIVAVGGGSPIDLAKGVALLVNHPGPLEQYALVHGGLSRITANLPPVIAVPTTAGTGSEVGRAALLTLETGNKLALISPHLIPRAAICDPQLTLSLPAELTAATGMDAIAHCVETYCAPVYNPVADAIALDGLERACRNIQIVTGEPNRREARKDMMMAALQGGMTFQKGLGAIHALSHPLGALPSKRLHHGTLNAIFLPRVLRYNQNACAEKMQVLAARLGTADAQALPQFFAELTHDLGLPPRLRDLGVTESDLGPLAEKAIADHCSQSNPRPMTQNDCRELYAAAL